MSDFPCTQCGQCCRTVGNIIAQKNLYVLSAVRAVIESFPYKTDRSGTCEMFINGVCSVYENRPTLCNIEAMGKLYGYEKFDWYKISIQGCNHLITAAGLDDSYLIKDYDPVN